MRRRELVVAAGGRRVPHDVWLWPYWPVRKVDRDGQQSGNETKLFVNVVPRAASRVFTFVMTRIDSTVWSSVIRTTMFGLVCVCWISDVAEERQSRRECKERQRRRKNLPCLRHGGSLPRTGQNYG